MRERYDGIDRHGYEDERPLNWHDMDYEEHEQWFFQKHFESVDLSHLKEPVGMKWVRATDRLPEFVTTYCVKVDGRCGFGKFFESEGHICFGFEAMNGFGTLEQYQFDMIEWLDESNLKEKENLEPSDKTSSK